VNAGIVIFGGLNWNDRGRLLGDTWVLDQSQWTRVITNQSPAPRQRAAMVHADCLDGVLLFGGQSRGPSGLSWPLMNDTWIYRDKQWVRHSRWFSTTPAPRCGHMLAYDEAQGVIVLFGGISSGNSSLGDTWIFNGRAWKKLVTSESPPARRYAAFCYHPRLHGCLLQGGAQDDNGRVMYGDTWLLREGEWISLPESFETDVRDDHGMGFHYTAQSMVLLEGLRTEREVLTLGKDEWNCQVMTTWHPRHQCSPLAWHHEMEQLVLYGGEVRHGGPALSETWGLQWV